MNFKRIYRGYKIQIIFDPANKSWVYEALKPVTTTMRLAGVAKTRDAALKAAERKIDEHG